MDVTTSTRPPDVADVRKDVRADVRTDVRAIQDDNETANYTIKDVTRRDRRRMRTNARKHGVASRELLTLALDALEDRDARTSIVADDRFQQPGPTIDQSGANHGLSAPASPLDELKALVAIDPALLTDTVLQRRLRARARHVARRLTHA